MRKRQIAIHLAPPARFTSQAKIAGFQVWWPPTLQLVQPPCKLWVGFPCFYRSLPLLSLLYFSTVERRGAASLRYRQWYHRCGSMKTTLCMYPKVPPQLVCTSYYQKILQWHIISEVYLQTTRDTFRPINLIKLFKTTLNFGYEKLPTPSKFSLYCSNLRGHLQTSTNNCPDRQSVGGPWTRVLLQRLVNSKNCSEHFRALLYKKQL